MPAVYERNLMTCAEAARVLSMTASAVLRLAAIREIKAVGKIGRPIRFDRQSVEQLAERLATDAEPPAATRRTRRPTAARK
jgi:excisionase family DNA binding protein